MIQKQKQTFARKKKIETWDLKKVEKKGQTSK